MRRRIVLFARTGVALILFGISVNALVVGVGLGITRGEMMGHASDGELARMEYASDLALGLAVFVQVVIALILNGILQPTRKRVGGSLRFFLVSASGFAVSVVLALISVWTGGAFVFPRLSRALEDTVVRISGWL